MISKTLLAASAIFATPVAPLEGQLNAAIWHDLEANAMIGNGDWLASLLLHAGDDKTLNFNINQLQCRQRMQEMECRFMLSRDGGKIVVFGEDAPENLQCVAAFQKGADTWQVIHQPPRRGSGHSKSSMTCKIPTV